jgi:hypothetical protein
MGQVRLERLQVEHSFPTSGLTDEELVAAIGLETPQFLKDAGLELKPPQLLYVQFAKQSPKNILSFEKGMGKTIAYMLAMYNAAPEGPWLIICGKSAMLTQYEHAKKYWPDKKVIFIRGNDTITRKKLWETPADIYCVAGQTFLTDMGYKKYKGKPSERIAPAWCNKPPAATWDEWHRFLRNRGTASEDMMLTLNWPNLILSSGSAGGKGPQSSFVALRICEPKLFRSYWKYVGAYCVIEDTPFGKKIVAPKNVEGWRRTIGQWLFHRKKDLKYYPTKTRQALPVEMEPWQRKIHDELKKNLLAELPNDALLIAPNVLAATHKIRQLMICPRFLDPNLGWGAGLEGILEDSQASELSHFVISTPYTGPMDLLQQFFRENKIPAYGIKGGMEFEEIAAVRSQWTQTGGVVIQSILFAESYELPAASNMYMLGYLHDWEQNSQAEDRIHRDIRVTPHPVNIYYVKHKGSYDEKIVEAMSMHADNVHALMNQPIEKVFNL